jgi:ribosomal protein S18 acetylase RimI-like enzyme
MRIEEITGYTPEIKKKIDHFLKLLSESSISISDHQLEEIISSGNSHLFFAIDDNENCIGMLTVGIYQTPTGKKAWIEDVVVDTAFRGQGTGKGLTEYAIQFTRRQQVEQLALTSNPTRIAANNLYKKLGFELKETNVYRMTFK